MLNMPTLSSVHLWQQGFSYR